MKKSRVIRLLIGVAVGSALGYAYYYFIGCSSGRCPITSNPWMTIGYGAVVGAVFTWK